MTHVPRTLEEWNLEAVQRLVDLQLSENDQFDIKYSFEGSHFSARLRSAVCSFANSRGGFLVFGVGERGNLRERITGLPRSREYVKLIQDQLIGVEPSVFITVKDPPIEIDSERVIVVVHVPQGRRGPHWDVDEKKFWRRGHGTRVEMTHEEVRMAFIDHAERVGRMRLLYLSLIDNWIRMDNIVKSGGSEGPLPVSVVEPATIRSLLADVQVLQPDLLEPLMNVLRSLDIVASRCTHMMSALGHDLHGRQEFGRLHKSEILRGMLDLQPQLDWMLKRLQDAYAFESVAPRGAFKIPPLTPPGLG